jgi:hypothetical protein
MSQLWEQFRPKPTERSEPALTAVERTDPRQAPSGGRASGVGGIDIEGVGELGSAAAPPQLLKSSPRTSMRMVVPARTPSEMQRGYRAVSLHRSRITPMASWQNGLMPGCVFRRCPARA